MQIQAYSQREIGKRDRLEDFTLQTEIKTPGDLHLLIMIVCDGAGGGDTGELASRLTANTIIEYIEISEETVVPRLLMQAVQEANRIVYGELHGTGTTSLGVIAVDLNDGEYGRLYIASVGDPRILLIRNNQIARLNIDHTLANEYIHAGQLSVQEANRLDNANYPTRVIGIEPDVQVDIGFYAEQGNPLVMAKRAFEIGKRGMLLQAGDTLVIATDGLFQKNTDNDRFLSNEDLLKHALDDNAERATAHLINYAKEKRSEDNISLALAFVPSHLRRAVRVGTGMTRRQKTLIFLGTFLAILLISFFALQASVTEIETQRLRSIQIVFNETSTQLAVPPTASTTPFPTNTGVPGPSATPLPTPVSEDQIGVQIFGDNTIAPAFAARVYFSPEESYLILDGGYRGDMQQAFVFMQPQTSLKLRHASYSAEEQLIDLQEYPNSDIFIHTGDFNKGNTRVELVENLLVSLNAKSTCLSAKMIPPDPNNPADAEKVALTCYIGLTGDCTYTLDGTEELRMPIGSRVLINLITSEVIEEGPVLFEEVKTYTDTVFNLTGRYDRSSCLSPFLDSDFDGVPYPQDLCEGELGKLEYSGCILPPGPDRDGDGVPDDIDACPDVAGLAEYSGCTKELALTLTTTISASPSLSPSPTLTKPEAIIDAAPISGRAPLTVRFSSIGNNGNSTGLSYLWNFGDGTTSTAKNPSHTYTKTGNYIVTLTIVGPGGTDSDSITIQVTAVTPTPLPTRAATATLIPTNQPTMTPVPAPRVSISYSPANPNKNQVINFNGNLLVGSGPVTSWQWNFGNGATSNVQNPNYTYTTMGIYTVRLTAIGPGGTSLVNTTITVGIAPTAIIEATPSNGNLPLTVNFNGTGSSPDISSYQWDFGDGTSSNLANPAHIYASAGTYTASLTVQNPIGSDTKTTTIIVDPVNSPNASFTTSVTGLLANFTSTSTGTINQWQWNFGDGSAIVSTGAPGDTSHTYATAGTYVVTLLAIGPLGTSTSSQTITVGNPPVAAINASPLSGAIPLDVTFNSASTGTIDTYYWNFGDGTTSSAQNPGSHIYATTGNYLVTHTVSNAVGSNSTTQPITAGNPPDCSFTPTPITGASPLAVTFTTPTSDGNTTQWVWNFGDTSTQSISYASPTTVTGDTSHNYTTDDTVYTVTLTASGPLGSCTSTATITTGTAVAVPITAAFTADTINGTAPLTVTFTDTSTGTPTSWLWDFGDGTTSTVQNPSHTFTTPGNYTTSLTVTNATGSGSSTQIITVNPPAAPAASFTHNYVNGTATPSNVTFTNTSTGIINSYHWDFGDGTSSTSMSPSKNYTTAGIYQVILTVSGPGGSSSASQTLNIGVVPSASFNPSAIDGPVGTTINFNNTSTGDISYWEWDFGDGSSKTTFTNPPTTDGDTSHTFTTAGIYPVTLLVRGPGGSDSAFTTIRIGDPPVADFTVTTATPWNAPAFLDFDATTSTGDIDSYSWDFGDGFSGLGSTTSHYYAASGTYTVTLTTTGPRGTDTFSMDVTLNSVPPIASFLAFPSCAPAGTNVLLYDVSSGEITYWEWDFENDGIFDLRIDKLNPPYWADTYHVYPVGIHTTTLRAVGPGGQNEFSQAIDIGVTCPVSLMSIQSSLAIELDAQMNIQPSVGAAPLGVQFSDNTQGNIQQWLWDFGDGNISEEATPFHVYTETGLYTVTLVVWDDFGFYSTTDTVIVFEASPTPTFTPSPTATLRPYKSPTPAPTGLPSDTPVPPPPPQVTSKPGSTRTPTSTATLTPSLTPTSTLSIAVTVIPSSTPNPEKTLAVTQVASPLPSATPIPTHTPRSHNDDDDDDD